MNCFTTVRVLSKFNNCYPGSLIGEYISHLNEGDTVPISISETQLVIEGQHQYVLQITREVYKHLMFLIAEDKGNYRYVTSKEFAAILDEFSKLYTQKNKEMERIDYDSWKYLVRIAKAETRSLMIARVEGEDDKIIIVDPKKEMPYALLDTTKEFNKLLFPNPISKNENQKEKDMPTMKFDFGPVTSDAISISPYGMAVKDSHGNALAYNPTTGQTVDVTGFTFDFKGMIYKMPAAINAIQPGDMVLHNGRPMYVTEVNGSNISTIDILASEAKTVIPVANMFGFNFVTKIVSMLNIGGANPSPDQPFGNLMPIMMASMVFGNDGDSPFGGDMDMGKMFMMSAIFGGASGNPFANMFNFGQPTPTAPAVSVPCGIDTTNVNPPVSPAPAQ